MKNKLFILFILLFSISMAVRAQEKDETKKSEKLKKKTTEKYAKKAWSIGAYGGLPVIFGDVNIDPKAFGYGVNIQKALSSSLALRMQLGMGTAKGVDRKYASRNMVDNNPALNGKMDSRIDFQNGGTYLPVYFNYKMSYKELYLQLIYNFNFNNDYRLPREPRFDMYMMIGLGGLLFNTYTDQWDDNANKLRDYSSVYNDYANGRITQDEAKKEVAKLLDGNYETACEGNPNGGARSYEFILMNSVAVPVINAGVGVRFRLSDRMDLTFDERAGIVNNDLLDGQRYSKVDQGVSAFNDFMFLTSVGINIRLGRLDNIYWFDNPSAAHYKMTLENKRKIALLSSDVDHDGVSDYFDKDLETPEGVKVDASGVPLDSDNDGIPDYKDMEPFSGKGAVVDSLGVPIDSDGDGVPDYKDLDNNTPKDMLVNFQGVPIGKKGSATGVSGTPLGFLPAIFFDFDDATLKTEFLAPLAELAAGLKYNKDIRLKVIGFTDNIGSPEYNKQLGLKRAQTVANYLIMQGIDPSRLEVESKGETEPLTSVKSADANRLNRRVQFKVIQGKGYLEIPTGESKGEEPEELKEK